jgi:hypothetical protein
MLLFVDTQQKYFCHIILNSISMCKETLNQNFYVIGDNDSIQIVSLKLLPEINSIIEKLQEIAKLKKEKLGMNVESKILVEVIGT